ncbi:MAG: hypothetical protein HUU20_26585 [Pirellulales bacterium]|nr:hypothetical protein [Pirellulales bacterium]
MLRTFVGWSQWFVVLLVSVPPSADAVQITAGEKPQSMIVLPLDPPLEIRHTAEEFMGEERP